MKWKPWLITGVCCLGVGVICSTVAVAAGALDQNRYVEKLGLTDVTDTVTEPFSSVLVEASDAHVILKSGEIAEVKAERVSASEYSVQVKDETLQIEQKNKTKYPWYQWFQIGTITAPQATITVTLPEETYRMVAVASTGGDCTTENLSVSTLSLDVDCGTCTIASVTAASCTVSCDMGDCRLSDSVISGTALLDLDCGDLELDQVEIGNLCRMENRMGNIHATDVTCGSSAVSLDCGNLTLEHYTETEKLKESTFLLKLGDMQLKQSVLYGADITMECGDLDTKDAALYANTTIDLDLGDIRLDLRGKSSDYQVLKTFTPDRSEQGGNIIFLDANESLVDISVTFTES